MKALLCVATVLCTWLLVAVAHGQLQVESQVSVQSLYYKEIPTKDTQKQFFYGGIAESQLVWLDEEADNQLVAELFYLYDAVDEKRRHFDVREFYWLHQADNWETQVGIGKVFWGVTESRNIVNIINQQDVAYGLDKSYRLGQLLLRGTVDTEQGVFSLFMLPYFRAQTYAGPKNPAFITDASPIYQDDAKENHIDWAARYSHYIDEHEFALSCFTGTNRTPVYIMQNDALRPLYRQATQLGLEYQLSSEGWLWKLEAVRQSIKDKDTFFATVFGFEYTFVGIHEDIDLGLLAEVNWDERGHDSGELLQNDTFFAARFTFNDVDSSELLLGLAVDNIHPGQFWQISGTTRFGEAWKTTLSGFFFHLSGEDPLASRLNNNNSFVELQITYFF